MNVKQLARNCIFATGVTALIFIATNVQADNYATPVCKASAGQCFQYYPEQPNTAKNTIVTAQIYSGFPWEARVPNPSIEIDGSVVRVTGTFVHCAGCIDSTVPPPVPYTFALPLLPAGSYSLELRLKPDPSYVPLPAVDTGNGGVVAGVFMTSSFTVTTGTLGALEQVIEYFDPTENHYFMTPLSNEIALLDARQPPFENWVRTGFAFNAYAADTAPQASAPICRFFNDSFGNGNGSHSMPHRALDARIRFDIFRIGCSRALPCSTKSFRPPREIALQT